MERFLFDLDGTLMNADFELENQFLRELFPSKEEADLIIPKKVKIIEEYEFLFPSGEKYFHINIKYNFVEVLI